MLILPIHKHGIFYLCVWFTFLKYYISCLVYGGKNGNQPRESLEAYYQGLGERYYDLERGGGNRDGDERLGIFQMGGLRGYADRLDVHFCERKIIVDHSEVFGEWWYHVQRWRKLGMASWQGLHWIYRLLCSMDILTVFILSRRRVFV